MKIERRLSFGSFDDDIKHSKYTSKLKPEERISLLEELRYDLGEITGYDYSQRFERIISILKRK